MPTVSLRPAHAIVVACLAWLPGCHSARPASGESSLESVGRVITADQIARTHASDAWDLLKRTGAFHMEETSRGDPGQLHSLRGRSSVVLMDADTPMIIIDGARATDIGILRQISASEIQLVRILNGRDGTTFFGTNSGGGVIIITTKTGPSSSGSSS